MPKSTTRIPHHTHNLTFRKWKPWKTHDVEITSKLESLQGDRLEGVYDACEHINCVLRFWGLRWLVSYNFLIPIYDLHPFIHGCFFAWSAMQLEGNHKSVLLRDGHFGENLLQQAHHLAEDKRWEEKRDDKETIDMTCAPTPKAQRHQTTSAFGALHVTFLKIGRKCIQGLGHFLMICECLTGTGIGSMGRNPMVLISDLIIYRNRHPVPIPIPVIFGSEPPENRRIGYPIASVSKAHCAHLHVPMINPTLLYWPSSLKLFQIDARPSCYCCNETRLISNVFTVQLLGLKRLKAIAAIWSSWFLGIPNHA